MTRPDENPPAAPVRILFVCSGNTCRSPMAEVLIRRQAAESGSILVEVRSAGTNTISGFPASEGAKRAARNHGLSLEEHTTTELSPELIEWADWILTMSPGHLSRVRELGGGERAALLGAFGKGREGGTGEPGNESLAVPDPFGGDGRIYEETFLILERYVKSALKRLAEESNR